MKEQVMNKKIRAFVNRLTGRKSKEKATRKGLPATRLDQGSDRGVAPFSVCLGASVCLSALVTPASLFALPQDGKVAAGSASMVYSASRLDVRQATDKAVIDWRSFNIAAGEQTRFIQPSASSMTLNRVSAGDPSTILGALSANGRVMLVNPNGVFFGPGSRVDVGGLVATTADIANEDFMAGNLRFAVPSAAADATVINEGSITVHDAGLAALVAPVVANRGVIQARLGKVALAAGNTFTLDLYGDNLVQFAVGSTVGEDQAPAADSLVTNSGLISADGGTVLLTASAVGRALSKVVNMDGIIEARAVEVGKGGEIILHGGDSGIVSVSGTIDVSGREAGQQGGSVKVLGDKVGLFAGAVIDAAGAAGGGEVLVGGDFQGVNPAIRNASATYVAAAATITADGVTAGDGGKVIVWADGATRYDGDISARGGSVSGDGGFVEVSGKSHLDFSGTVDTSAENGATGTLLLDPADIVILDGTGDSATDGDGTFAGDPSGDIGAVLGGDTSPSSIHESELEGIAATTNIVVAATNNLTISDLTDNNLTLQTGPGNSVSFIADSDASGAGAFSMAVGDTITTAGADVSIAGAGLSNVSVTAAGAHVALASTIDIGIEKITSATVNAVAGGSITDSASAAITVTNQGVLDAGGSITLGDTATDSVHFGSIDAAAGSAVTLSQDSDMVVDGLSGTSASLTAAGSITDSASATIAVTNQGVLDADGSITLGDTMTDSVNFGRINAAAVSAIAISEDSGMVVAGLSAATASLTATGSITDRVNAVITVSGQGVLDAGGAITLGDTATDSVNFGSIAATAGAAVAISADSDMVVDGLTAAGAALTTSGNITDSANAVLSVTGQGALHAGGSIILGDTATDSVNFGSIDATAGAAVAISADSDMVVDGLTAAGAALTTSGDITDSANAVLSVTGQGVLHAGGLITLGDTATDSVHFGSIDATAGSAVALSEDSDMVVDGLTAASAALSTGGDITDSASAVIAVAGQGVLQAGGSITLGEMATDSVNFGSLDATAGSAVTLSEDSAMVVDGLTAASAALSTSGDITDSASSIIAVAGQGVLQAGGSITLGDTGPDSVNFGSLAATAGTAVTLSEDSDMVVDGLSGTSASLTAAGSITDSASATIAVTNQGVLDADGSITLGDTMTDSVNFGRINAAAVSAIAISEDSGMVVAGLSAATASLTAAGSITDRANATIAVSGQGVLDAGGSITLGDTATDSVNFGSIDATAGAAVTIREDSDMLVDGLNGASASLTSTGSITDSASAVIAVAGQGVLQAGGSITLGDTGADSVDFGSIDATAGAAVALNEDSAMAVDGLIAASAALNSSGNITDSAHAIIAITGQGDLTAGGSITLGDTGTDSVNFGSIAAAAGSTIAITEDSDMALSSVSGTSVSLASTGSMDDADAAAEATANVTGNQITLHAAGSIGAAGAGGDIDISAAALTAEFGGSVYVHNAADFSSLRLISTSVAASSYEIAGNNLAFAGAADGTYYQLADVSLTSGPGFDFSFRGDAGIAVGSVNAGNGNVTLTSMAGSILDAADDAATDITAAMATLAAAGGIGGTGTDTALETAVAELEARVTGAGDIHIVEADDLTLQTVAAAAGDFLITSGGSLSASASAIIDVAGQGVLHAGGSITLGDTGTDSVNFDSIAAAAGTAVAISEDSDMVVDGLNAASVSLISAGAITDRAGGIIAVTGQGVLHAGGLITLGDTGTDSVNFGSLDVTAGAAAAISEDSDMMVDGFNAASVALHAGGNMTDSASAVIDVAGQGVLQAGGSITLGDTGTDRVNFGSIDAAAGTAVAISEDSAMVVDGLTAASAALRASGNISDSADAVLSVAGQGVLDAGGSITLGDTGTDSVNFGSLNAMAGTAAAISEDSDMLVDGLTAASAALRASGNISDSADAIIAIAGQGVLDAGGSITLGDTATDSVNFGSIDAMAGTIVTLSEDSDMVIDGLTAAGAVLNASGNITDSASAIIAVAGQGVLDAGGSITLGDTGTDSVHFGSLDITAGTAAAISEDSAMVVDGLTAAGAALRASGNITDSAGAIIAVSGQGALDAGGSITLGDTGMDSVHFGSLNATAGTAVAISEDSGMVIDGLHAVSAALNASGSMMDSANAVLAVSGQGVFHAGSAITLGDTGTDSVHFGSLDITAGTTAAISEDSGMVIDGLYAASAALRATGNISDSAGAIIAVSGQGALDAGGSITLGDTATDSVHFGSLNATAGTAAAISEDSGMVIDGLHAASAALNASENISDSAGAIIAVSGQGVFHAGSAITLGDTATDSVNFGSIDATAGTTVAISEDSDMVVVRLNAASAMLTATRTLSAGRVNADHITFSAEEMNFTGGPGSIVGHDIFLQPVRQDQHISVAGTGDAGSGSLDLSTTDLAALADGFAMITIGRVNGTGRIDIPYNQFGWKDPVTFNAPDGGILTADVSDSVTESYADDPDSYNIFTGTGDASFTFMADSPTTFWLNGNIKTAGGDVFIDPDITTILRPGQINPAVKITDSVIAMDTDGGDITFGSMLGHTTYLMLLAGITETVVDGGTINGAIEVYGLRLSGSGGELGVIITSVDNDYSQDKWPAVYTIVTLPAPHYGSFTFNDLPVRGLSIDRDPQNAFLLGLVTFFGFSNDLFSIESYALPEGYSDEEEGEEGEDQASDTTPSEAGFGLTGSEGDSQ